MAWRPERTAQLSRSRRPAGADPDVDLPNLRRLVAYNALVITTIQGVTATLALRRGRRDYADAAWGPGLAACAVVGAIAGRGDVRRRSGLATVTSAWAARLAHQMLTRIRSSNGEDPRYTEFLQDDGTVAVIAKVFVTQGLSQLAVSAPLQLAAASPLPRSARRWLSAAGLAVMSAGTVIEALADRQKSRYSALEDPDKPNVLDTGLWGWSRHPNYFGDSLVWDGAWLCAAASAPAALAFPAPVLMSYLLIFATGARRTERRLQERPGYRDYQRRVAFFFPRAPSRD